MKSSVKDRNLSRSLEYNVVSNMDLYKVLQMARARYLNEPGTGEMMSEQVMVGKATELSHYSTKKIHRRKGMRVRRVYVFQADVTAKYKGMDSGVEGRGGRGGKRLTKGLLYIYA